jgi:heme iron utilization protein
MNDPFDPAHIADDFRQFIAGFNSLILATVSSDGLPESSYAPFIHINGRFYIYVSELAGHTRNLLAAAGNNQPSASLLWIEPEDQARNIFARKRATISASVTEIPRSHDNSPVILDAMAERFGEMISLIRQLGDFHLIELTPHYAGYVTGFAKAYRLEGEGLTVVSQQKR